MRSRTTAALRAATIAVSACAVTLLGGTAATAAPPSQTVCVDVATDDTVLLPDTTLLPAPEDPEQVCVEVPELFDGGTVPAQSPCNGTLTDLNCEYCGRSDTGTPAHPKYCDPDHPDYDPERYMIFDCTLWSGVTEECLIG